MKIARFALAAAALVGFGTAAYAADLPSSHVAPQPYVQPIAAATINWTGFYLGGTVGGLWTHNDGGNLHALSNNAALNSYSTGANSNDSKANVTFGANVGYNYQFGSNVVAGVELDYNWANADRHSNFVYTQPVWNGMADYTAEGYSRSKLNSYGSLRARIGYLVSPSFLIYATGGVAMGEVKSTGAVSEYLTVFGQDLDLGARYGSRSKTLWGWTVGGGAEYALNRNWSVKAEYLYTDLGNKTYNFDISNQADYQFSSAQKNQFSVARVGVNYRF